MNGLSLPGVRIESYTPAPPLSRFVASIWYAENAAPRAAFERLLPNGDVDLVVNVRAAELRRYDDAPAGPRRFSGPIMSGAHCRPYAIDTAQQAALLGVKFRPGGAFSLIGVPADELRDDHVALADLWGAAALELQERVMAAATSAERFRLVEAALLARMTAARGPHPAVARAVRAFVADEGGLPVAAVAQASGLSDRRFIELFRRDVGLTPKVFCRVVRFGRALRALAGDPGAGLASGALAGGYYDQAHFIREFKAFTGMTPGAYRSARGAYDNHVPIDGVKSVQYGPGARD